MPEDTIVNLPGDLDGHVQVGHGQTEHDTSVRLAFRGVSVTVTLREQQYARRQGLDPDTVVVLIDQDAIPRTRPVAVYLDDDVLVDTGR